MKFTVLMTPKAEQELALIWVNSIHKNSINSAVNLIDDLLAKMPHDIGESSFDTVRTFFVTPIAIEYEVIDDDRIVYILSIWEAKE